MEHPHENSVRNILNLHRTGSVLKENCQFLVFYPMRVREYCSYWASCLCGRRRGRAQWCSSAL